MVYIIYMAAGNSRRFGANKLLHKIDGKRMFEHGLDTAIEAKAANSQVDIIVISQYEEILEYADMHQLKSCHSPESINGLSFTIKAAINALRNTIKADDYLCFMTADQPYLKASTLEKLIDLADNNVETASLIADETPGNPALIRAKYIPELLNLTGDQGGRRVVNNHSCIYIEADKSELRDIDEIKDININGKLDF